MEGNKLQLSFRDTLPLALQHVVAMFVPTLVPMILVSRAANLSTAETTLLIQCAMLGSGIASIIHVYPIKIGKFQIGSGLPVVLGLTYVFMPMCISVATDYNIATIFGAQIAASFVAIIFGFLFKKMSRLFPKIVTGTVVMSLGFSIFNIAITNLAGGSGSPDFGSIKNWSVGILVVIITLICQMFGKGMVKSSSILIGMVVGYIVAIPLKMVDFSPLGSASWFSIPKPLAFGIEFEPDIIFVFAILYIVVSIQLVGDMSVSAIGGHNRQPTGDELSGGIIGNGLGSLILAFLNSFPTATYSQNSGIVALNHISDRRVFRNTSLFLIFCGICPKLGTLMSTMPNAVIGGGTLIVFATIAMSGVSLVTMEKFDARSRLVVGISVAIGLGVTSVPNALAGFNSTIQMIFGGSAVVTSTILAVILNLIFPKEKERE